MAIPMLDVQEYDPKTGLYLPRTHALPMGDALKAMAVDKAGRADSAGMNALFALHNTNYRGYLKAMQIDERTLKKMQIRQVLENSNLRPLFPSMTETAIRDGINMTAIEWEPLIGATVDTTSMSVEWFTLDNADSDENFNLRAVSQGAEIPVATVSLSGKSVILNKKGRGIQWTDEALSSTVSLVEMYLRVQGIRLGQSYYRIIADRLISGYLDDGSDDPTVVPTDSPGVFSYEDLLVAKDALEEINGYPATDIMASPSTLIKLKLMTWGTGGAGGPVFPNGDLQGVLGMEPHRNSAVADDMIVIFNRDVSLVRYVYKPFSTEEDRMVSRQLNAIYATITDQIVVGMAKGRVVLDAS